MPKLLVITDPAPRSLDLIFTKKKTERIKIKIQPSCSTSKK